MPYRDYSHEAALILQEHIPHLTPDEIKSCLSVPPKAEMGDISFVCHKAAKGFDLNPVETAKKLRQDLKPAGLIEKTAAMGPYLNLYLNRSLYIEETLSRIADMGPRYGDGAAYEGKVYLFDYSSPNIAKPFHIGHLPGTVVGEALCKLYETQGAKAVRINHIGDWGTQYGKLIAALEEWGKKTGEYNIGELSQLYVKFHKEAENNPELETRARDWSLKLEGGDAGALKIWKQICDISLDYYRDVIYKRLGIQFDFYTGESFYRDKTADIIEGLKQKNLLRISDGASIVNLEQWDLPPCLLLRSDGASLYALRDIAAALYRKKEFNFDGCVYITCKDQTLHFKQWIKVLELLTGATAAGITHLALGQITFAEGKLSTRHGNVILLEGLLDDAKEKIAAIMQTKRQDLTAAEADIISEQVATGAIKFSCLYNGKGTDSTFNWERALSFEGESGPYAQYTYVRMRGIIAPPSANTSPSVIAPLSRHCEAPQSPKQSTPPDYSLLTDAHSFEVVKLLQLYPSKLYEAAQKYEPYIVTRYMIDLCKSFNRFYNSVPVRGAATQGETDARLCLVSCAKQVLSNCLTLLGIAAPEKM